MSVVSENARHPYCETCHMEEHEARELIRRVIDADGDVSLCGRCLLRLTADQKRGAA